MHEIKVNTFSDLEGFFAQNKTLQILNCYIANLEMLSFLGILTSLESGRACLSSESCKKQKKIEFDSMEGLIHI